MGFIQDQTILYTTPVAADLSLENHILAFINGTEPSQEIDYRTIQSNTDIVIGVTEVPQISTYDPITASVTTNTAYKASIRQKLADGTFITVPLSFTTPSGGTINGTLVSNAFKEQIRLSNLEVTVAPDGVVSSDSVPTAIVTAAAGSAIFSPATVTPNNATFATGTAGVVAVGQGQDLIDAGVTGAVAGQEYDYIVLEYLAQGNKGAGSTPAFNRLTVWYDNSASTAFEGELDEILGADDGAGVADPDAVSIEAPA